jgi:sulfonate transport system permease protein
LAACALWSTGELQHHLTVSLGRVTQCLALGVSSGIALAIVAGLSKAGEEVVGAPSQMLRMLAMVRLFIPLRGTCLSLKP